jgi:hypothetical protein
MKALTMVVVGALLGSFFAGSVDAHVPYFEGDDFSQDKPFRVESIEQSIAVYAWLKREKGRTNDIDVYTFTLTKPTRVFVQCIVPVRTRHEKFLPLPSLAQDYPRQTPNCPSRSPRIRALL